MNDEVKVYLITLLFLGAFNALWLAALTVVVWQINQKPSELAQRLRASNDQLENAIKPKEK